jgi:6-phosphofructokinase 2
MPPDRIVTLTLNPAIDLSATTSRLEPLQKLRCTDVRRDPGGGGINVARVIARLDGKVTAIFPSGGISGKLLEQLLRAEGLNQIAIATALETREDVTIFEEQSGQQYRFVMPGAALSSAEQGAILDALAQREAELVVLSGSLPQGTPPALYGQIARAVRARGQRLIVDSSDGALKAALAEGVFLIKPNARELSALSAQALTSDAAFTAAARAIVEGGGAEFVALSLGDRGAWLIGRNQILRASAPRVRVRSTVGAGDSFTGGFAWALAQQQDLAQCLRYGVAAGTAAILGHGTQLAQADDVHRLARVIAVHAD